MFRELIRRGLQVLRETGSANADTSAMEIEAAIERIEQAILQIRAEFGIAETG